MRALGEQDESVYCGNVRDRADFHGNMLSSSWNRLPAKRKCRNMSLGDALGAKLRYIVRGPAKGMHGSQDIETNATGL